MVDTNNASKCLEKILFLANHHLVWFLLRLIQARHQSSVSGGALTIFRGHKNFIPSNSRVKTIKKKVFIAKSAKKRVKPSNTGLMISILGVSGLELRSSGTDFVTFFGAQSSLEGAHFSFGGGTASKCSPWRRAWLNHHQIIFD